MERLQVFPQGREMEIHGQLVPEQEARELEGEEVLTGGKGQEEKVTINEAGGGREDEERRQTKAGGKEQRGKKKARQTTGSCEWMGRAGGNA